MKQTDSLKQRMRNIRFTTEHQLTKDQFNKLVEEKLERARHYHFALTKREIETKAFDR